MTTRSFGAPVTRNEDARLLSGRALFVDDVELPGMLHAAFLRSNVAHARINSIDVSAARKRAMASSPSIPPKISAITGRRGRFWFRRRRSRTLPSISARRFRSPRTRCGMSASRWRWCMAESRYLAEDALSDIALDLEPLPAVVDLEKALADTSASVHDGVRGNLAAQVRQGRGNYAAARARADRVISAPLPLRSRRVFANGNARHRRQLGRPRPRLTVWDTTQAPVFLRNGLAGMLGLSERQVRVIAPFVGGGFGPKIMLFYPEEVVIPWVAMKLNRPVKWIEDRLEHFFATTHERGQTHDAEIALSADGRILGVKDNFLHDTGAYNPYGLTVPINSQCTLLGPYVIPNYDSTFRAIFTNKPIVTPYRGAGRQHGVFVIERLLDIAARELDIDRAEISRRNLIPPDAFPYNNEIIYQDFAPLSYDSGNYEPILDKALEMIGYCHFLSEEQPRLRAQGRHVGIGIVCYVEGTGIGPYEGAKVQVQNNGKVSIATGIGTQGQGHFTVFAQVAADQLGVIGSRHRHRHRRYRSVLLGRRHLREPRRGGCRQCRQRGGQSRPAENPETCRRTFRVRRGGS